VAWAGTISGAAVLAYRLLRYLFGLLAVLAGARAAQQARYLAMDLGDLLGTLRFLIHDRDPVFTTAFGEVFRSERLRIITTLPKTLG